MNLSKLQLAWGLIGGFGAALGFYDLVAYPLVLVWLFKLIIIPVCAFTGGIKAKGMLERGEVDGFLVFCYAPLIPFVLVVDVVWNITVGSVVYRELPREWLFTTRTKRHFYQKTSRDKRRLEVATKWARRLNWIDPGHV